MHDRRLHPRRETDKRAKILVRNSALAHDCRITDQSAEGARIEIPSHVLLPASFSLMIPADGLRYDAEIRWRERTAMGVRFRGPGLSAKA